MDDEMPTVNKDELTVSEIASLLKVARSTVWSWIKNAELPAKDISNPYLSRPEYRVKAEDLQKFIEKRKRP